MVKELNENEFNDAIKSGKVLVDCYATWCGPCKMQAPIIDALASEMTDVSFCKLDIDKAESIAMEYGVMYIPTLLYFEDGNLKDTLVGLRSKDELEEFLK